MKKRKRTRNFRPRGGGGGGGEIVGHGSEGFVLGLVILSPDLPILKVNASSMIIFFFFFFFF